MAFKGGDDSGGDSQVASDNAGCRQTKERAKEGMIFCKEWRVFFLKMDFDQ